MNVGGTCDEVRVEAIQIKIWVWTQKGMSTNQAGRKGDSNGGGLA